MITEEEIANEIVGKSFVDDNGATDLYSFNKLYPKDRKGEIVDNIVFKQG